MLVYVHFPPDLQRLGESLQQRAYKLTHIQIHIYKQVQVDMLHAIVMPQPCCNVAKQCYNVAVTLQLSLHVHIFAAIVVVVVIFVHAAVLILFSFLTTVVGFIDNVCVVVVIVAKAFWKFRF